MENFRVKFINENIKDCAEHRDLLTPWERDEFLANIITMKPEALTTKQFNTLSGMATKIKSKIKPARSVSVYGQH